ncbi:hypothetical protein KGQ72_00585 [Patescibacteria group bacterium]|nr:hypothetical protein [Patescibacteria group bacterium]
MEGMEKGVHMGVYFPKAKSEQDLNPQQLERFKAFRAPLGESAPALAARIKAIKEFIGPVMSGEMLAAEEELIDDSVARWVLAGEDPEKVKWLELKK